jgi:hypothetical protein
VKVTALLATAVAMAAVAGPALAATVYVSLPLADDATYDAEVTVANSGTGAQQASLVFLESNTNGAQNRPAATKQTIAASSTVVLSSVSPATKTGLLEVTGTADLGVSARVALGGPNGLGFDLPVISTTNSAAGNGTMLVQGLVRNGAVTTTQVIVNLGSTASQCTVTALSSAGVAFGTPATITLPPRSQRVFPDALVAFGVTSATDVLAEVTCNQRFFTYGVVVDTAKPDATVLGPALQLDVALAPPGSACATGATCYTLPGNFFTPAANDPYKIYKFPVDIGLKFRRLEARFKWYHGGWNPDVPGAIFTLFYINRLGKFRSNTFISVDISASPARVFMELTADLPNAAPPTGIQTERQRILLTPGETYDVTYIYDAENRRFDLKMVDSAGNTVVDVVKPLKSATPFVLSRGPFWIQFSEPGTGAPLHRPNIGWRYSDFTLSLIP